MSFALFLGDFVGDMLLRILLDYLLQNRLVVAELYFSAFYRLDRRHESHDELLSLVHAAVKEYSRDERFESVRENGAALAASGHLLALSEQNVVAK